MGEEVLRHLAEIEKALTTSTWQRLATPSTVPSEHAAEFYTGESPEWSFVVSTFDIASQGFPAGTRGYDGAARNKNAPLIVRMTRPLAEKAAQLALVATVHQ